MTPRRHPCFPWDHKFQHLSAPLFFDYLNGTNERVLLVAAAGRRETVRELLRAGGQSITDATAWDDFLRGDARLCSPRQTSSAACGCRHWASASSPNRNSTASAPCSGAGAERRAIPRLVIRSLSELRMSDPVVHEDHGIGRYLGLQTLDIGDGPNEFLALEYADGDKLYLPVLSLHLITRYTGTDPEHAPLHKLGGDAWEKAKRRALEKAGMPPQNCSTSTPNAPRAQAMHFRRMIHTIRPLPIHSRSRKHRIRRAQFPKCSLTWNPGNPWTGWCAATSALAKPRWRYARRSWRPTVANRLPCWCPRRYSAQQHFQNLRPFCGPAGAHRAFIAFPQQGRAAARGSGAG